MTRHHPLTVLHVIEGLMTGGAERQLIAFLLRSDAARFRHEVCVLSAQGEVVNELEAAGIPVRGLELQPRRDLPRAVLRLRRLVASVRPDIIHATLYRPGVVSRIVGRLWRIPVVTSLVSMTYEPEWYLDNPRLSPWKAELARIIDGATARRWGTRFVAITESVKKSAVRQLGLSPETITVIPRGVPVNGPAVPQGPDRAELRAAFGWTDDYPVILNVARLVPQKGQRYVIRAMAGVKQAFPRARLVIAGDGWQRPLLEELIKEQGLQENVTLLGERQDIFSLLVAADIFVFPSIVEGLGNALIEAMAAGVPCVASRIPALREVTGDGSVALLAELQSPSSLTAGLLRLADDRAFATALGESGRTWVRQRFNIQHSVAALESLYERVAAAEDAPVKESSAAAEVVDAPGRRPVRMGASPRIAIEVIERAADFMLRTTGLLSLSRRLDKFDDQVLRVLVYHRVADPAHDPIDGDPGIISATPEVFAEQIRLLARHYEPIGISDLESGVRGVRGLPRRAVLVTFDDGYRDFLSNAWPVLRAYSVPAVLFVPTAYPDSDRAFWWDELWQILTRSSVLRVVLDGLGSVSLRTPRERATFMAKLRREMRFTSPALVQRRMQEVREAFDVTIKAAPVVLSWEELRALAREGLIVASHGRSHVSMPSLTEAEIALEIDGSQEDMERELGAASRLFAFPFGHYDSRVATLLQTRGFIAAFGTGGGRTTAPIANPFALSRQSVNAGHTFSRVQMGLSGIYPQPLARLSSVLRPGGS